MEVHERIVQEALRKVETEPGTGDAAWFAARQPGIVRYLEGRLGVQARSLAGRDPFGEPDEECLGLALLAALAIHGAFERALGAAPPRVPSSALERAETLVVAHARSGVDAMAAGATIRQRALSELVAGLVASSATPLADDDQTRIGLALLTVIYAIDGEVGAKSPDRAPPASAPKSS